MVVMKAKSINIQKVETVWSNSVYTERALGKTWHSFMVKKKQNKTNSQQARLEENCLSLISASVKKFSAKVVLMKDWMLSLLDEG